MIVKRLTQALKRQDWAVVSIEFVLVVAGVLLAFQINEWSNGRAAANDREAATDRLLVEAEETVAYMRQTVIFQETLVDDLNFALLKIQVGQWRLQDEKRMSAGFFRARTSPPLSPPSSVYDDLVASGAFGKIGNAELRSTIANYRSALTFSGAVREKLTRDMPRLEEHGSFRYVFTPEGRRRLRLDVDFQALRRDGLLLEKLAMLADDQRIFLLNRRRVLTDAKGMCVRLGRYVGRACNLDLPLPTFD